MCKHGAFRLFYLHETIGSDNLFSVNLGIAFKVIGNKISCQTLCYQRTERLCEGGPEQRDGLICLVVGLMNW